MTRVVWLTDIHLDFCDKNRTAAFLGEIRAAQAGAILLGGDIHQAHSVAECLQEIARQLETPVFFVLGNHDYYHGSIDAVRKEVRELTQNVRCLSWLPLAGVVGLTPRVGLVGHGGWGDGRLGDYASSQVRMNDFVLIDEFINLDRTARLELLHKLGDEAATHFQRVLPEALARFEHVILLTHVPPFRGAAWHEGATSAPDFLPYFTCQAVGDVIQDVMTSHPERELLVLCGHTHGSGTARPLPNITVLTGGADYGQPRIQRILDLTAEGILE